MTPVEFLACLRKLDAEVLRQLRDKAQLRGELPAVVLINRLLAEKGTA